jgi:hypothetical protein
MGTIRLLHDHSILPHGISRIDVLDPEAFRRYHGILPGSI